MAESVDCGMGHHDMVFTNNMKAFYSEIRKNIDKNKCSLMLTIIIKKNHGYFSMESKVTYENWPKL